MADDESDGWGGLIVGPGIVVAGIVALCHNEGRFDHYKAAPEEPLSAHEQNAWVN